MHCCWWIRRARWTTAQAAFDGLADWPFHSADALMFFPRVTVQDRLLGQAVQFPPSAAADRHAAARWRARMSGSDDTHGAAAPSAAAGSVGRPPAARTASRSAASTRLRATRSAGARRGAVLHAGGRAGARAPTRGCSARGASRCSCAPSIERGTRWVASRATRRAAASASRARSRSSCGGMPKRAPLPASSAIAHYFVLCDERLNGAARAGARRVPPALRLPAGACRRAPVLAGGASPGRQQHARGEPEPAGGRRARVGSAPCRYQRTRRFFAWARMARPSAPRSARCTRSPNREGYRGGGGRLPRHQRSGRARADAAGVLPRFFQPPGAGGFEPRRLRVAGRCADAARQGRVPDGSGHSTCRASRRSKRGLPDCPIALVHGWRDEVIPCEQSMRFAQENRLALHLVESDHRLHSAIPFLRFLFQYFLDRIAPRAVHALGVEATNTHGPLHRPVPVALAAFHRAAAGCRREDRRRPPRRSAT